MKQVARGVWLFFSSFESEIISREDVVEVVEFSVQAACVGIDVKQEETVMQFHLRGNTFFIFFSTSSEMDH